MTRNIVGLPVIQWTPVTGMVQPRWLVWEGFGVGGRGSISGVFSIPPRKSPFDLCLWTFLLCPPANVVMGYSCLIALITPSTPPFHKLTMCSVSGNASSKGQLLPRQNLASEGVHSVDFRTRVPPTLWGCRRLVQKKARDVSCSTLLFWVCSSLSCFIPSSGKLRGTTGAWLC